MTVRVRRVTSSNSSGNKVRVRFKSKQDLTPPYSGPTFEPETGEMAPTWFGKALRKAAPYIPKPIELGIAQSSLGALERAGQPPEALFPDLAGYEPRLPASVVSQIAAVAGSPEFMLPGGGAFRAGGRIIGQVTRPLAKGTERLIPSIASKFAINRALTSDPQSAGQVAGAMGKGAAEGAALGVGGAVGGKGTEALFRGGASRVLPKIGRGAGMIAGETAGLVGGGAAVEGELPTRDDFVNAFGTVLGFRAVGGVKRLGSRIFTKRQTGVPLSREERKIVNAVEEQLDRTRDERDDEVTLGEEIKNREVRLAEPEEVGELTPEQAVARLKDYWQKNDPETLLLKFAEKARRARRLGEAEVEGEVIAPEQPPSTIIRLGERRAEAIRGDEGQVPEAGVIPPPITVEGRPNLQQSAPVKAGRTPRAKAQAPVVPVAKPATLPVPYETTPVAQATPKAQVKKEVIKDDESGYLYLKSHKKGKEILDNLPEDGEVTISGTFYHTTNEDAAELIRKGGFNVSESDPNIPFSTANLGNGVYLSADYYDVSGKVAHGGGGESTIIVKPKRSLRLYSLGHGEGIEFELTSEKYKKIRSSGYDGIIVHDTHPNAFKGEVLVFDPSLLNVGKKLAEDLPGDDYSIAQLNSIDIRDESSRPSPSTDVDKLKAGEVDAAKARMKARIKSAIRSDDGYLSFKKVDDDQVWSDLKLVTNDWIAKGGKRIEDFFEYIKSEFPGLFRKSDIEAAWKQTNPPEREERPVGLNIEQNKAFAERMGLDELERPDAEKWIEARQDAIENGFNDPNYVQSKADAVLDDPENVRINRAEQAGLLEEYVRLEGELDIVMNSLQDLKGNLKSIAEGQRDTLIARIRHLQEASEQHRTEDAWGMQFGRALKKGNQYTSARMLKSLEAVTEKPTTDEQKEAITKHKMNIAAKEKTVAEAEDKDATNKAKIREKRAEQSVERERRLQERIAGRNRKQAEIDADIEAEINAIKAMGIRFNDVSGVTVEGLQHLGKLVALYAEKGGISFADAADKVLARLVDTKLTRDDLLDAADMMTDKAKEKQKQQGRRMVKALSDSEKAVKDAGKAETANDVKKAVHKLENAARKSGYTDSRLQKILAKIKEYQDALERSVFIRAVKRAPDPTIIAEAKKILSELRSLMRAREKAAEIRAKIARGDPVAKINIFIPPPSAMVLKARAELAEARREWDAYVARHSKITASHILNALLNVNKPFVWGFDMSVYLIQLGRFASANPIRTSRAVERGVGSAFSPKYAARRMEKIKAHPLYDLAIRSKLPLKDPNDPITQPEEMFNNRFAIMLGEYAKSLPKVPQYAIRALPEGIKASNRGFVVPVNEMLMDMFSGIYETHGAEMTENGLKQTANLLGTLVGRGKFGKQVGGGMFGDAIESLIRGLQTFGFMGAPRLFASMAAATPRLVMAIGNRHLRRLAIRQLSTFYGTRIGLLTLIAVASKAYDWELEFEDVLNIWSPNFGKIKFGNTRYDIWAGHSSQVRTLMMALLYHWRPKEQENLDLNRLFSDMVTRRQSPFWRLAFGMATGRDWLNRPTSRWQILREGFMPISSQDIVDLWGEGWAKISATGFLAFLGGSAQTYDSNRAKKAVFKSRFRTPESIIRPKRSIRLRQLSRGLGR